MPHFRDKLREIAQHLSLEHDTLYFKGPLRIAIAKTNAPNFLSFLQKNLYSHCYCQNIARAVSGDYGCTMRANADARAAFLNFSHVLQLSAHCVSWQPGFVVLHSRETGKNNLGLARIYFNSQTGDFEWIRDIYQQLDRAYLPFRIKFPAHLEGFDRRDTVVLYLQKEHVSFAWRLLARSLSFIQEKLLDDVPLFTKRIAHGISFAEDPSNGRSFGTHCCFLVAEAIEKCVRAGKISQLNIVTTAALVFKAHNQSLAAPYLRERSKYPYDFTTRCVS